MACNQCKKQDARAVNVGSVYFSKRSVEFTKRSLGGRSTLLGGRPTYLTGDGRARKNLRWMSRVTESVVARGLR